MTSSRDLRRMYRDLAWLWPIISPWEHYVDEAGQFAKLIDEYSEIPVKDLLHLGCGAGHIDKTLKKRFAVTGVDISEEMLALARGLNPDVEYIHGDMRSMRLGRYFDAVIAADSITYMVSEEDLRNAFATASEHLKPGGVFCTYAEQTVEQFVQNRTELSLRSRGDVEVVLVENSYDPDTSDTTCEFAFIYIIRRGGRLKIETDCHVAGLFKLEVWVDALRDTRFDPKIVEYPEEHIPMFICVKPP